MTDLEISKALAIAIGYTDGDSNATRNIQKVCADFSVQIQVWFNSSWRTFDYRDWNVIGPIAAKYNWFPARQQNGWRVPFTENFEQYDTPQKAIALAVIGGKK
jgi:hypothetical protein